MSTRTPFNYDHLHPAARGHFIVLSTRLETAHQTGRTKHLLKPFEGYRSLEHQQAAFDRGVSKALPWQSAHQYGLAVDYVPFANGMKWFWPEATHPDWEELRAIATNLGLICNLNWDRPHVVHPVWDQIKRHLL